MEAQQRLGHPDALTLSTAGLLAVALGSDTDKGAESLSSVIENAPPGSQHGLVACNNLAMCYERRRMYLQAFHAFKFATDLAQKHFKEDDPVVAGVYRAFAAFLIDHVNSVSPSHMTIRLRDAETSATSTDNAGNDASS